MDKLVLLGGVGGDLHRLAGRHARDLVRREFLALDGDPDRGAQVEQGAQIGIPLDDQRVLRGLPQARRAHGSHVPDSADHFVVRSVPEALQALHRSLSDRQRVDGVVGVEALDHLVVEDTVRRDVEVRALKQRGRDLSDDLRLGQHPADDADLGLRRVRNVNGGWVGRSAHDQSTRMPMTPGLTSYSTARASSPN
jgi:hypothetical protein